MIECSPPFHQIYVCMYAHRNHLVVHYLSHAWIDHQKNEWMNTDSESNVIEGDRKKEKRTTNGFTLYIYAQRI